MQALSQREEEKRRELGVAVVRMYREDDLETEALGQRAEQLVALQDEIEQVAEEVNADPDAEESASDRDEKEARTRLGYDSEIATPEPAEKQGADDEPDAAAATPAEADRAPAVPPAGLDALASEIEEAEQRMEASGGPRAEAERQSGGEALALERDLEREKQRAADALAQLQAQLGQAEQRALEAEQGQHRGEAEAKAAAAEWLRGQAAAMRREAERQVRAELSSTSPEAVAAPEGAADERIAALEAAKQEAERALAEMTQRSNEANARAQKAEAALARQGRSDAAPAVDDPAPAEEPAHERDEKSKALEAAERRLAEIEAQAIAASERVESAERRLAEETERIEAAAEERIRQKVEAARGEAETEMQARLAGREAELEKEMRSEAERIESEAEAHGREAAAAWLRGQVKAIRREVEKELKAEAGQPRGDS